ncbi:hypothetical protein [Pseudonocardia sp. HH130630-07]|uniref:hypothetical protein n=1 Tax=Pseudonocardia sp. HH130630-07 TaxID=1690815 RepID=UPI0012EAAFD2|nr:hypothetical protein [Pseudonocardia sp. HH130630-07]
MTSTSDESAAREAGAERDDPVVLAARLLRRDGDGGWQRILRTHVPDHSGSCAGCAPSATGRPRHPCLLRVVAQAARDV